MIKNITATQARDLIKDIPDSKFITDQFTNNVDKCCPIGHITRLSSDNPNDYTAVNCSPRGKNRANDVIYRESKEFLTEKFSDLNFEHTRKYHQGLDFTAAVDNRIPEFYNQSTIKLRAIACLDDMIAAGY